MKSITIALLTSAVVFSAGAVCAQSLEGTARTFYTTSSGVSNFSHNKSGANTVLYSVYASASVDESAVRVKRHRHQQR